MFKSIKFKIQNFGQFLSNIMMPNISIFIAWGIMSALFMPLGWKPNKVLAELISPMIFYLLPILIGYTGGRLVGGERGGIIGSITTIGMITSTKIPMLLGGMVSGVLGGWIIKNFDILVKDKIKNGFEMLVNNFSIAIIGIFLTIISFFIIGPFIEWTSSSIGCLLKTIIHYNLLPFIAIIIEPAKIFFLNNTINHGIFSPLGLQDILENKNSIFFLIESNPGPGLGVLLACFFFGKGDYYKSAGGAAIIEFLGGVHEVYFPYVLMNPKFLLSLILGSMTNIFILIFFQGGLIGAVSPGSILSILAMTKKNFYYINIFSIFSSFFVSFLSAIILLKLIDHKNKKFVESSEKIIDDNLLNYKNDKSDYFFKDINTIVVACDAGMGSSAIGASILREKIRKKNLIDISIHNVSIHCIPKNADIVITHKNLTSRAKQHAPNAKHISLVSFLDNMFYDALVNKLIKNKNFYNKIYTTKKNDFNKKNKSEKLFQLSQKNIILNQFANNKEEAIKIVGKHLVEQGYVKNDYIDAMLEREKITSTWLGEHIALPHGTIEAKDNILKTGIIFCQFPNGVRFGDNIDDIAYLVIGIAAKNNEHVMVVSKITNALDNPDIITKLSKTKNIKEVLLHFNV
ncbi:PTS mannitol transporter subunit IICBA [Buchnera aphidicola (Aphis craccivora)]|nr:PTS mannitol transporter subunit IICBA [Buchnera aphidicola]QCI16838.1 PTS mannitol transporter subunit IICBA [Buchnera aphidicola (Aphis craccivora)]QLL40983.1 PTS mannitol transporter subunit IICBA [Buchnera aphidicola (Aphis craccivore)]WAI18075.1 MAG: PTS mannitol transporter subunit IICBA [Buchnera aphidicola (Aphis craccivora)]